MSIKKHGLGRGINSLIDEYSSFEAKKLEETGTKVQEIDVDKIKPNPNQPRKQFDPNSLLELRDSIAQQGVIQPILVEEIANDVYIIIAGERRYRASKMAGLKTIPSIVRSYNDIQRMEISLIENIQRENLNPVEEAQAFSYLISQSGISQDELAKKVGKGRSTITNSLRLLNLPQKMLEGLSNGDFSSGHARALLSVENPADRDILYKDIIEKNLSVRQAEEEAASLNNGSRAILKESPKKVPKEVEKAAEILQIEEKFLCATGCKVEIKGKYKNGIIKKGKLTIPFSSEEELERIYQILAPGESLYE